MYAMFQHPHLEMWASRSHGYHVLVPHAMVLHTMSQYHYLVVRTWLFICMPYASTATWWHEHTSSHTWCVPAPPYGYVGRHVCTHDNMWWHRHMCSIGSVFPHGPACSHACSILAHLAHCLAHLFIPSALPCPVPPHSNVNLPVLMPAVSQ